MIRTRPILLTGVLALSLTACQRNDHQESKAIETPGALATPAPQTEASAGGTRPSPEPTATGCGADKLGKYLNLLPTSDAMDDIRKTVGHDRIRMIEPDDIVTLELRPDRLDIEIGVDGRIKLFRCG